MLWARGQLHNDSCLHPTSIPIIWFGRIGNFLIFIAGLAIVVDIIGDDGLIKLGQFLKNNSKIEAGYRLVLPLLGTFMMKKNVDLSNQSHPPLLLRLANGLLFWSCMIFIFLVLNSFFSIWHSFFNFINPVTAIIEDCSALLIILPLACLFAIIWLPTSKCFLQALSRGILKLASLFKKDPQRANQDIKAFSLILLVLGFILQLLTTN